VPVRVLVGPAGCGKTGRAFEIFKQFAPSEHQGSVRLIAPTLFHVLQIRRVLLSDHQFPGLLGDPVCTFYELTRGILAQMEHVKCVSEMHKLLLLNEIIGTAPCGYFDVVRERPNFAEALGGAIRTLKAAAVAPEHLRCAVQSADARLPQSSKRKILDLADIYQSYQQALAAAGIDDREGIMWRALEVARGKPELLRAFKCIIIDGFPSLTPVQQEFVRLLAGHCGEMIFTIDYQDDRPEVFSHVEPTFRFLAGLPGASVERMDGATEKPTTALGHVRARLFAANPPLIEPDDSAAVLAGATPAVEIELAAREIKRLVREQGLRFGDFALVSRDVESYRRTVAATFGRYGIPLAAHSHPLSENALAQMVLLSLGVASTEDGTLEARARTPSTLGEAFKTGGARHLAQAVEGLVAGFQWQEDDRLLQEDCAAWKAIRRIMAEITAAEELLGREIGPGEFAAMLESGIHTGRYRTFGGSTDGVSLLDAGLLRGQEFPVVFLVGLLERTFPRQAREDPFLRDDEREALNPVLPHQLSIRAHDWDYERHLFYTAASSARDYLYLCYPAASVSGHDNAPSRYLREIERLFTSPIRRIRCDYDEIVPPVEQAETPESSAAAVVLDCCAARDERRQYIAAAAYNLMLEAGRLGPDAFEWLSEREAETSVMDVLHDEDSTPASEVPSVED